MSDWFQRLFHHHHTTRLLRHQFGRGINAQINPEEPRLFDLAVEAFRADRTIEAFEYYLRSLENFSQNQPNQNVLIENKDDLLEFTLYQGCAIVRGKITKHNFSAYAVITTRELMDVAVKRHLLERNDLLTYANYAIHDNDLILKLSLDNTTMTPQKIFYPLRELALNADYEKEYLHYHYEKQEMVEVEHLQALDEDELQIKYDAMQEWITACQKELTQLPSNDNISMISFTLLSLIFQIDYLLVPHGDIMQEIFEKVNSFFTEDERLVEQKNDELLTFVQKLQSLDFESFKSYFYKAKLTFSPTEHTTTEELNMFIEGALEKYHWFKHHRYTHVASTINQYIPLYILYNYGLHPSYRELLHLLVEVQNSTFFAALEYKPLYDVQTQRFDKSAIISAIEEAIIPYQKQFANLTPFGEALNYTTMDEFSHTYFLNLKNLDYTEL